MNSTSAPAVDPKSHGGPIAGNLDDEAIDAYHDAHHDELSVELDRRIQLLSDLEALVEGYRTKLGFAAMQDGIENLWTKHLDWHDKNPCIPGEKIMTFLKTSDQWSRHFESDKSEILAIPVYAEAEAIDQKRAAAKIKKLKVAIPLEFRKDINRNRPLNWHAFDRVLDFDIDNKDGRGLYAYGAQGSGKTRAMFRMLWLESLETIGDDIPFIAIRAVTIADLVCSGHHARDVQRGVDALRDEPILFIDDIDKPKLTPRFAQTLYDILDIRRANGTPTLLTGNSNSLGLCKRWLRDDPKNATTIVAILTRIKDHCNIINFDKQAPATPVPAPVEPDDAPSPTAPT